MDTSSSIPEEWVPVVLEKASRLYQEQQNEDSFSLDQLVAAGAEVEIPPAVMQQAYAELQQEQAEAQLKVAQRRRTMKMAGAIAAACFGSVALWAGSTYNALSQERTRVAGKWAQVENQMQRRADLIPQLTQVAEGYADREEATIQSLNNARETFLSAQTIAAQRAADEEMKAAIAQFQTFAASNQQLQSSELFVNLQYEIAGTENRIATERMRYNQAVENYNRAVESFPNVIIAKALGFESQPFSN